MSNFKQWLIIVFGFILILIGIVTLDNYRFKDTSKQCLKDFQSNPYSFDKQMLINCRYISDIEARGLSNKEAVDLVINNYVKRLKKK